MPERPRPNPSFCVVTLSDAAKHRAVNDRILDRLPGEAGQVLSPLGEDRFVVARPAVKRLLFGRDRDELIEVLKEIDGIRDAAFEGGEQVRTQYRERASVAAPEAEAAGASRSVVPKAQWNLRMVKAPKAWKMFPGGRAAAPWNAVRVGHIDTGYTEHPVLGFADGQPSDFVLAHEGINYLKSGSLPRDPLGYKGQPGHGTRTMSVLGGNIRGAFLGVAPGVSVVPYRLTNSVVIDSFGNETELDRAIRHAVFDSGCDVISISLGDPCLPPSDVGEQVDAAYKEGVIIVAAAGNVTSEVTYPGRYHRTIAVGGVTEKERPWTGGSRGRRVDICAPADDIYRATADRHDGAVRYRYGGGDGTSYATVHVSAAAALWIAFHGANLDLYGDTWRRVEAFRKVLKRSASRPDDWNRKLFGAGILDIHALLNEPLPEPGSLTKSEIPAAGEWS